MEGWGRENGPAKWDPDTPKAAGEAKPRDLELGKEDQELGPAWLGQGINSKGRDVSHGSGEKETGFRTSRRP